MKLSTCSPVGPPSEASTATQGKGVLLVARSISRRLSATLRSALIGSVLALTCSLSALAASFEEAPDGRVVLTVLGEKLAFREQDLENVRVLQLRLSL